jgi:dTDP-glucose 4,6-dehydratase
MQNVLVTGADGFIGSHLTEMLKGGYNDRVLSYKIFTNKWT